MTTTTLHDAPVDETGEAERRAFNAAFYELGLQLYWDKKTYQALAANPCEHDRVRGYLQGAQSHLLRAYDADFLADAVIRIKQRCQQSATPCATHAAPELNWAEAQHAQVGF